MELLANETGDVYHVPTNGTGTSKTGMCDTQCGRRTAMWKKIFLSEFVLIFIINTFTLIGITGNRHLRKRTLFLVINLTVADLLAGVVSGPLMTLVPEDDMPHSTILRAAGIFFISASLVSVSLISLDRLYATLHPFRHCLIGKYVYFKVIACSWVIALFMASFTGIIEGTANWTSVWCVTFSYTFITLFIIAVSFISIRMNVKKTFHSHSGVISSETKLSMTLFIMIAAYMLTILPLSTWWVLECSQCCQNHISIVNIEEALVVLYSTNAIVNPLIYALRMREFRKGIKVVFCKVVGRNYVQSRESNRFG